MEEPEELQMMPNESKYQMHIPHSSPVIRLDSRSSGKRFNRFQVPNMSGSSLRSDTRSRSSRRTTQLIETSQQIVRSTRTNVFGALNDFSEKLRSSLRLPPVQRQLRPPLSFESYLNHMDFSGRIINFRKYRHDIFMRGFDPRVRIDIWRMILGVFPRNANIYTRDLYIAELSEDYYRLKVEWLLLTQSNRLPNDLMNTFQLIRGDVQRTDRSVPFYSSGTPEGEAKTMQLYELLCMYTFCHPSVGYHQGMADLASVMLFVQRDEAQAYMCLCALMQRMADTFKDQTVIMRQMDHIQKLLSFFDPQLEALISNHKVELLFGPLYRWLMLELKREFEFEDVLRLLEMQWVMARHKNSDNGIALTDDAFVSCMSNNREAQNNVRNWLMGQSVQEDPNLDLTIKARAEGHSGNTVNSWISVLSPSSASTKRTAVDSWDVLSDSPDSLTRSSQKPEGSSGGPTPGEILLMSACEVRRGGRQVSSPLTQSYSEVGRSKAEHKKATRTFKISSLPEFREVGVGNPFLVFLCLSMLMEYRDQLLKESQDDVVSTFVSVLGSGNRRHNTSNILNRAYYLFKHYLHEQKKMRVDIAWLEEFF